MTTLLLGNGTSVQLVLIYRSPSVSVQALISLLTTILDDVSMSAIPTVVLGDFNEDCMSSSPSPILSFMSSNGFNQLVQCPTTDRGTLIDHVYYSQNADNVVTEVNDTYYSDHDTVYCSIPLS